MTKLISTVGILTLVAIARPSFAQERFDSPEAAASAVIEATASHDNARLTAIFGPSGAAILTSGDPAQDKAEQSEFSKLAATKYQLVPDLRNPNRVLLSIGDEDWPFPAPIVKTNGKWSFDPSETRVEMQARRIGADELDAIEICVGYVEAQKKYASEAHEKDGLLTYAAHMMNPADPHNALYSEDAGQPLIPRALAEATWDGAKRPVKPYHGYYFRILVGQGPHASGGAHNYLIKNRLAGGFGLVAWPAQYGTTGINTFMVNHDGIVYLKDIAPPAGGVPVPITRFDPDPSWRPED